MTRSISCFAALAIAAIGSVPASATYMKSSETQTAMHQSVQLPMSARYLPDVLQGELNSTNLRGAIKIDETNPHDFIYRALFQNWRGELPFALADARTAIQLKPYKDVVEFRDNLEHKIARRAFEVTAANNAAGLENGFSRVAYYR